MPQQNNPCFVVHKIYDFGIPFLGQNYYMLCLFDLCLTVEKLLKEIHSFYTYYPINVFKVAISYRCNISNLVRIGPFLVLEKKMLSLG